MRVHQVGKGDGGETDRCDDAAAPGRIGRAAVIWRPLFVIAPQGQRRKADGVTTAPEKESSEPGLVGWIAWVPLTGAFILFGIFLMIWAQIF